MIISEEDYLAHYGILRKSGRYPWGSGENPYQRNQMFLQTVSDLKKEGMTESEIAKGFGITTTELRAARSIAKNENRQADINQAQRLKDKGYSNVAIGERMGINESSVRALLKPGAKDRADALQTTSNMLKEQIEEKGMIDVGVGTEHYIGVSRTRLKTAIAQLKEEGYKVHYVPVQQLGTNQKTTVTVLSKEDVSFSDVVKDPSQIKFISTYSEDNGRSYNVIEPPTSIESKRVKVNYAEDGGAEADGTIYVRPGVDDISLGASRYAQVRIGVDDTHYLKGVAIYKDDLPDGVDLVFNTNKRRSEVSSDLDAMKPMKLEDPDNPFGASINRQNGVMNIVREEGEWNTWSKNLPSQMLSKQSPKLAKTQLDMTYEQRRANLDEIKTLSNPAVKRKLLEAAADDADSASVHLKAAAMPRQNTHVLLPVNQMKTTEIYAPKYRDGERVVLIRFPHGGIFEIPELTVNNRQPDAKKLLGNAADAVGINSKVAERLSGADFDGDTVLVIPNNEGRIKVAAALEGLKDFDSKRAYPAYEGMTPITPQGMQKKMGEVSNLITDMTIRGASNQELARAVRHSMVVIDSEKHNLDHKQSAIDNGILELKKKYQPRPDGSAGGASTIISRASSETRVPDRKPRPASEGGPIDRETGKLVFVETGESYVNKKGQTVTKTFKSTKLAEADDAHTLSSGTPIENLYADHSNRLKSLANEARLEMINTKNTPYSPSAKAAYSQEVEDLNSKLNVALRNAPLERQAQIIGNAVVEQKRLANPDMTSEDLKKIRGQELTRARAQVGAGKTRIEITPSEWEAIQAGAISNHKLEQILNNADIDVVRQLATPRDTPSMTTAKQSRARAMDAAGYTQAEIADALGVSVSTITNVISEGS